MKRVEGQIHKFVIFVYSSPTSHTKRVRGSEKVSCFPWVSVPPCFVIDIDSGTNYLRRRPLGRFGEEEVVGITLDAPIV